MGVLGYERGERVKKERKGIKRHLLLMVTLPTVILSVFILIFGAVLVYHFYCDSIRDELVSTTNMMVDCLDLTVRGDYRYQDGLLLKGDMNITDATMLYRVKEKSNIDTSIFWDNIRVVTTVEDKDGVSAAGTTAEDSVTDVVLGRGTDYFSDHVKVDDTEYIGYYKVLQNDDGTAVGMVFAGKKRNIVYYKIFRILTWFLGFSMIAVVVAVVCTQRYSAGVITDINIINHFLQTIADGTLGETLDERIRNRRDELGDIGIYADKMRDNLQKLVEMDALTSLYNRRSGNHMLGALVEQGAVYTAVMCDIDFFKRVNDTYGHAAGDQVLIEVSAAIRESVGDVGFASRWGGEEFLAIYRMELPEAKACVEALQKKIRKLVISYGGSEIQVTMTFGMTESEPTESYEQVVKRADDKLYIGKNGGRNQIVT